MAKLRAATFSVLSILVLSVVFNITDGVPFNSGIYDGSLDKSSNTLDTAMMIKSRAKRDLIDSMLETIMDILGFPFRLMSRLFASVFNFIWSLVMAPIYYITDTDDGTTLMERLQESLRNWLIDMMWASWDFLLDYALPKFDEFIVAIKDTAPLSDGVRSLLNSIHAGYQMLRMLSIL